MGYICNLTVTYDANGGSGAPARQFQTSQNVETFPKTFYVTLRSGIPIRDGFEFLGWSLSQSSSYAPYSPGGLYTYTFTHSTGDNQSHTTVLYAVWAPKEYVVFYRKGTYGSGTDVSDTKYGGTDLTLRGKIFTRSGYKQTGWSTNANGNTYSYGLGGKYTANAGITLYPYWSIIKSTITSVTDSVPADGTTQGTVSINKPNSEFTHTVLISLGTRSQEFTNVDTSLTFTIPVAWLDQIPNATSAVATVSLTTYKNGSQVGTPDTKSFVVTVPSSVVPTITLTGTNQSSNNTVSGWNVLVQGYSQIALTAAASSGSGATITSIAFSGEGVSQIGTGTTVTSELLTSAGSKTWTATVTDSRGRTATATLTRTVHEYYPTAILAFSAFRSTAEGNSSPSGGQYITAAGNYSFASCDGHNSASVKKIEYKKHTDTTWTTGENSAASGTRYTFGPISLLYVYDVKMTVTDSLGTTASYIVNISSVDGVSFGLNGKCARFGGPVQYDDRFECDWDTQFNGQIEAPLFLQTGSIASGTVEPNTTKTIDVTFNTAFRGNPFVAVSLLSPQTVGMELCTVSVWNISSTGFSVRITNGYENARSLGVCWIAVCRKNILVSITEQPSSATAQIGDSVNFSVSAVNATKYQWYFCDPFDGTWQMVTGDVATYASYILEATAAKDGFQYKCNVSNNMGSVETNVVELTVSDAVRIIDKIPYINRLSGGGLQIGNRCVDKLIGGTVCYNQKAPYIETGKWNVGTADSYTLSSGVATIHKNSSTGGQCNLTIASTQRKTSISGHKYLFIYTVQTTNGRITLIPTNVAADGQTGYAEIPNRTEKTYLWQCGVDKPIICTFRGYTGANNVTSEIDFSVENVECFDLTQMFGSTIADYISGLEQAEAGAGAAWLRTWMGAGWHAAEAGALLSVNTSAHVTRDANNNVIGNYPLDSSIELRGILKLDANNNLYYDGDSYESDGTVERRYGTRAYQSGDETDGSTMVTDGTTTVYALSDPTTETADAFQNPQTVDPNGSEEYTDSRTVPMPVGHETWYKSAT